jgi:hypothetical protein
VVEAQKSADEAFGKAVRFSEGRTRDSSLIEVNSLMLAKRQSLAPANVRASQ